MPSEPAASEDGPDELLEPLLSVRHLATGYGDLQVVWDVSFDARPGRILALLGRNGAGKTTVLRAIAGLNRTWTGVVHFQGQDIARLPAHRRVRQGLGLVQENKRVFHRRSTEENLLLGGYTRGLRRRRLRDAVQEVYAIFPALGSSATKAAGSLSGGQQQMLAIGQALMARPSLLMMDEPSAGLAPTVVNEVLEVVASLKDRGISVVLVEQAVEAAIAVADEVVVLDVGRVVLQAAAADIDDLAVLRDAYFGRLQGSPPRQPGQ